jgi:hypothetical protein
VLRDPDRRAADKVPGRAWKGEPMSSQNSKVVVLKQKAIHEFIEAVGISLYLAFFFCAIVTYKLILLHDFRDWLLEYGFALLNALVVAKVILIGEYSHLGRKHEDKALLLSSAYKAFLFGVLVFGFHIVEEAIKRLLHGQAVSGAFSDVRIDVTLARSLVVFCTFLPFFAFRELRRVLGEDKFNDLFFRARAMTKSGLSGGQAQD